jgi:hypothetical protein
MARLTHRFYNNAHSAWFTMLVVEDWDAYGRDMALTSDRVWYAVMDRSALDGLIAEAAAEPDPCP